MASAQQEKHHRTGQKPRSTAYRTEVAYFKWAFPMYPSFDDVMPYDTIWVHPYSAIPFQQVAIGNSTQDWTYMWVGRASETCSTF